MIRGNKVVQQEFDNSSQVRDHFPFDFIVAVFFSGSSAILNSLALGSFPLNSFGSFCVN